MVTLPLLGPPFIRVPWRMAKPTASVSAVGRKLVLAVPVLVLRPRLCLVRAGRASQSSFKVLPPNPYRRSPLRRLPLHHDPYRYLPKLVRPSHTSPPSHNPPCLNFPHSHRRCSISHPISLPDLKLSSASTAQDRTFPPIPSPRIRTLQSARGVLNLVTVSRSQRTFSASMQMSLELSKSPVRWRIPKKLATCAIAPNLKNMSNGTS